MDGWVCIHRKISENPIWSCEPFSRGQAWVDLILIASYKPGYIYVRGIKQEINIGQIAWSEESLSKRWQWSRSKVRKFLKDLEKELQISLMKSNVIQIITIENYSEYQSLSLQKDYKETSEVQEKNIKETSEVQEKNTYNNLNNLNKVNKVNKNIGNEKHVRFSPPTLETVVSFFKAEKGLNDEDSKYRANDFFEFYESKGWMMGKSKMTNWQTAASRSLRWEDKRSKNSFNSNSKFGYNAIDENQLKEKIMNL